MGEGGNKLNPPFLRSKIMNLLGFFNFGAEKNFPCSDSMEFIWGEVQRALMQLMHFSVIFAMLAVFGDHDDPVLPTLTGVWWDVMTMYAY